MSWGLGESDADYEGRGSAADLLLSYREFEWSHSKRPWSLAFRRERLAAKSLPESGNVTWFRGGEGRQRSLHNSGVSSGYNNGSNVGVACTYRRMGTRSAV